MSCPNTNSIPLEHGAALTHALYTAVTTTEVIDRQHRLNVAGWSAGAEFVF